jgi:hypothetical protein
MNSIVFRKSSCSDLQSRLKVRKLLGVGDTAGSKISQILGHSDHLIFQLPPNLTIWLLLTTTLFSCFTVMVKIIIDILLYSSRSIGSTLAIMFTTFIARWFRIHHTSCDIICLYEWFDCFCWNIHMICLVLATILGLALRSGDKTSLQLVLFSLALFHTLSFLSKSFFLLLLPLKSIDYHSFSFYMVS